MRQRLIITMLSTLVLLSTNAYCFQCPSIMTGVSIVHPVVIGNAGTDWILQDAQAIRNGWYIIPDPVAANHSDRTINASATLTVYLNSDNKGHYYPVCEYSIGRNNNSYRIQLTLNKIQGKPANSNYIKSGNASYSCTTTANHPEKCASLDIWQRPVVMNYTG